jgi:hypothetical protein
MDERNRGTYVHVDEKAANTDDRIIGYVQRVSDLFAL